MKIQYLGKNYSGSQVQTGQEGQPLENGKIIKTIQGELEKAISTLIKFKVDSLGLIVKTNKPSTLNPQPSTKFKTVFSGRTDAGVNALGQVVHFDTENIVASNFLYSLNEILPDDISVSDLKEVPASFHAQKSAKSRHYRYEFICRKCKNAFDGDLPRVKHEVNLERMQTALDYIKGEQDFSSFKSSGTLNPSKVCFIERAEVIRQGDKVIVDLVGNRFLYNMVRTIIGTLLEIEGKNLPPEHMKSVLEAKDRTKAGKTVSPYGLTLIEVKYE
jgi:tRNA pseudouridine38-40 synthase